ncbi:MAG: DUF6624 domain-containing protein [Bacteroidota bacterium]
MTPFRTLCLSAWLMLSPIPALLAQTGNCAPERIDKQLVKVYERDQAPRLKMMEALSQHQTDSSGQLALLSAMGKVELADRKNQRVVLKILEACGWPQELAEESHQTIFLVLQHSDSALMATYIPQVKEKVEQDLLAPDDWAIMYDRLLMWGQQAQVYGTQAFADATDQQWIWPVASVEELDERRAEVGLPTMQEYLRIVQEETGLIIRWDPTLTLEAALEQEEGEAP